MKKTTLLIALALLFGAKAFAQEWEWSLMQNYELEGGFAEACELSDGRIVAMGCFRTENPCGSFQQLTPATLLLDADGTELAMAQYPKDGYFAWTPFVLEDGQGRLFMLVAYNPDHDTCSPNYFRNFDPPTDHSVLGLYRLNDDLSIAESHEIEIPIDTFEWRSPDNHLFPYDCGQMSVYSAFVDDDGSIVGVGYKSVTRYPVKPRGYDSTCFFRMDFDGNLLKWKSYCDRTRSGVLNQYNRHHLVKADNLYLHYGLTNDFLDDNNNLAYLDHDFNIVRTRKFHHTPEINTGPGSGYFDKHNTKRNSFGNTYMTTVIDEWDDGRSCILYEFDDDISGNDTVMGNDTVVPIMRWVERKSTSKDSPTYASSVGIWDDDFLYFAYTLKDLYGYGDSWIVIEYLTRYYATWETLYYGAEGDGYNYSARSIATTSDGGAILLLRKKNRTAPEYSSVIVKFTNPILGVEEAHKNGFKLAIAYPNPGTSELDIRTSLRDARVEVYDAAGRLVHGQEITEEVTPIGTEAWPSGMYVWKVYKGNAEAETGKWVKE